MKRHVLYLTLIIGLVLDVMGLLYYSKLYLRQVNNTVDASVVQQYQRDHIFAQVYTMYGIGITSISIILLF